MTTIYFDAHYNKCTILYTDANLFMINVLICQLIMLSVITKPYVSIWNRNPPLYKYAKIKKQSKHRGQGYENT